MHENEILDEVIRYLVKASSMLELGECKLTDFKSESEVNLWNVASLKSTKRTKVSFTVEEVIERAKKE